MFIGRDEEIAVFDDDGEEFRSSLYFSKEMKQNLGLTSGFPSALTLNPSPKLIVPTISYIHHFSGAPRGAFQQPVYSKYKVRWLRVLARPLQAVHNVFCLRH